MARLPPELRKQLREYTTHQRGWVEPTGAVPAYSDTYLQLLEGMRPLRSRIQRYATSCGDYLVVNKVELIHPEVVFIHGKAITAKGAWKPFSITLGAFDAPRVRRDIELFDAGVIDAVGLDPYHTRYQDFIARLSEPIGMVDWGPFGSTPRLLRYCHELIEAIAQGIRMLEDTKEYQQGIKDATTVR